MFPNEYWMNDDNEAFDNDNGTMATVSWSAELGDNIY